MEFISHIARKNGEKRIQSVKEHSFGTCKYALENLDGLQFENLVKVSALLHDMGKCKREFTEYIEKADNGEKVVRGSVNHSFAGVIYILEKYHNRQDIYFKLASEIIAYAVGAHHGLFDCVHIEGNNHINDFIYRMEKNKAEISYFESRENFFTEVISEEDIDDLVCQSAKEVEFFIGKLKSVYPENNMQQDFYFNISMLSRFVLSCVVYGDRKDTELFMNGKDAISNTINWKKELSYYKSRITDFKCDSIINRTRNNISEQCENYAYNIPDIYRLNVPTGAGKTLSSLRYGIAHSAIYNKARIIFIVPLLSIIDQNSKVIKKYVSSPDAVLEYHSNVLQNESDSNESSNQWEYISDRWEKEYIISTLVQLLNILFSGKTTDIARMKSLYNSTIIIDEVQSLPPKMTYMFNVAVNFLRDFCNTTIILSSATQPVLPFNQHNIKEKTDNEMVKLTEEELHVFKRSSIKICHKMNMVKTVELCNNIIENSDSLLVICNKKEQASVIFDNIKGVCPNTHYYHLSTSMCSAHRLRVISKICDELSVIQKNQDNAPFKVVCISTQLVEAGVNFSFQNVVRITAGLDNLAQSAGRCNRGNEYKGKCTTYSVSLIDEKLTKLKDINSAKMASLAVYDKYSENELLEKNAILQYYSNYYKDGNINSQLDFPVKTAFHDYNLFGLLSVNHLHQDNKKVKFILSRPFKTISEYFNVFDDNTVSVIVPYEKGAEIIEELRSTDEYNFEKIKYLINSAKRYTVPLFKWQEEKLFESGMLDYLFNGKICVLNKISYDTEKGIVMNEFNTNDSIL